MTFTETDRRRQKPFLRAALLPVAMAALIGGLGWSADASAAEDQTLPACEAVGTWLDPQTGDRLTATEVLGPASMRRIVLLGESHTSHEDHRWQLHALAGLQAHRQRLVIGFEMFPRAVQAALDDWAQGRGDEKAFLEAARWREVWGYDAGFYLPLFHFVRQNRLPMVALNVNRTLVSQVGAEGWAAVPVEVREGLSDPAPASPAYRRSLAEVFAAKLRHGAAGGVAEPADDQTDQEPTIETILEREDFGRFVEAQLTWDRAMAEALFEASRADPDALVVGILGRGHIEHGHGVPHQLADLGEDSVAVLLPIDSGAACESLAPQVADAVFLVTADDAQPAPAAKPRLGVMIEQAETGVRVLDVVAGSVAAAAGVATGDVIVSAATFPVSRVAELIEIVQRQAPGTWLPLELTRDGETQRLVAEFPAHFE